MLSLLLAVGCANEKNEEQNGVPDEKPVATDS